MALQRHRSIAHEAAIGTRVERHYSSPSLATVAGMDEIDDSPHGGAAPEGAEGPSSKATPATTRQALLHKQARGYTAIRGVLVQLPEPDEGGARASVLARIVHEGKHRALLLYLLLLGAWPELDGRKEPLQADVWIRALTGPRERPRALTWSRSTLSRAWADLEELGLVERRRIGRLVEVTPRREDGQAAYDAPGGRDDLWNTYFVFPDAFWEEDGLFARLTLPGLAMLLLIAKETNKRDEAHFTFAQIDDWYGIKRRTAQNGFQNLKEEGVLDTRPEVIAAPLSPTGSTVRNHYSLTGDFGHLARIALRQKAQAEREARIAGSKVPGKAGSRGSTTRSKQKRKNR